MEKKFDLEQRTEEFADKIIEFAKKMPNIPLYFRIISQLIGAGTSIGANYCEATEAESNDDFIHKISISKKEAKETKFWLKRIIYAETRFKSEAEILWKEANELHLIFSKIVRTCRLNKKKKNNN